MKRHEWDYTAVAIFAVTCGLSTATGYATHKTAGLLEEKAKLHIELGDVDSAVIDLDQARNYRTQGNLKYVAAALFGVAGALCYRSGRSSAKKEEKK